MKAFESVEDILDFAMEAEQRSIDFYTNLADKARSEKVAQLFRDFARDAIHHKKKLMHIQYQGIYAVSDEDVSDMDKEHYQPKTAMNADMQYSQILDMVMQREKTAHRFYTDVAGKIKNHDVRKIFEQLAFDESQHKERFLKEYDDMIARES